MKKTIISIVVLVLLAAGVGVMASKGVFQSGSDEPMTIERTMKASNEITSSQFTGSGSLSFYGLNPFAVPAPGEELPEEDNHTILFTLGGVSEMTDDAQQASLNLGLDMSDLMEGMVLNLDARLLTDQTIYFMANELPQLGFFSLDPLEGQWVRIAIEDIISQLEATGSVSEEEIEIFRQQWELNFDLALQRQLQDEAIQLIVDSESLMLGDTCGTRRISGVATTCYNVNLDLEKFFMNVVPGLFEMLSENQDALGLTDEEIIESEEEIDAFVLEMQNDPEFKKALESITFTTLELWLGNKDALPYRVVVKLMIDIEEAGEAFSGEINFVGEYSNYNQSVTIEAPESSISIQEFLQQILGGVSGVGVPAPAISGPKGAASEGL